MSDLPPVPPGPPTSSAPAPPPPPVSGAAPAAPLAPAGARTSARSWLTAGVVAGGLAVGAVVGLGLVGGDDGVDDGTAVLAVGDGGATLDAAGGTASPGDTPQGRMVPGGQRGTSGTVTAVDGDTLLVDSLGPDGTTEVVVQLDDETVVGESALVTPGELTVGSQVLVVLVDAGTVPATALSVSELDDGGGSPPGDGPVPAAPRDGATAPRPDGAAVVQGGPGGGGIVIGTLVAVGDGTLTVEQADGQQVVVATTADTTATRTEERTPADIVVGDTVQVVGERHGDVVEADRVVLGEVGPMALGAAPDGTRPDGARPGPDGGRGTSGS